MVTLYFNGLLCQLSVIFKIAQMRGAVDTRPQLVNLNHNWHLLSKLHFVLFADLRIMAEQFQVMIDPEIEPDVCLPTRSLITFLYSSMLKLITIRMRIILITILLIMTRNIFSCSAMNPPHFS